MGPQRTGITTGSVGIWRSPDLVRLMRRTAGNDAEETGGSVECKLREQLLSSRTDYTWPTYIFTELVFPVAEKNWLRPVH